MHGKLSTRKHRQLVTPGEQVLHKNGNSVQAGAPVLTNPAMTKSMIAQCSESERGQGIFRGIKDLNQGQAFGLEEEPGPGFNLAKSWCQLCWAAHLGSKPADGTLCLLPLPISPPIRSNN